MLLFCVAGYGVLSPAHSMSRVSQLIKHIVSAFCNRKPQVPPQPLGLFYRVCCLSNALQYLFLTD